MGVRQYEHSKTWAVDFSFRSKRYRGKSPVNTEEGAKAYEAALRMRLLNGQDILVEGSEATNNTPPLFSEFADKWLHKKVMTKNKASEIQRKKYTLENSLKPFFKRTRLDQIDSELIEDFTSERLQGGLSRKTVNNHLTDLNRILVVACEWRYLEKKPKIEKLKLLPLKHSFLEKHECDLVLRELDEPWREIAQTGMSTGLRMGELRGLQWSDINWSNRTILVNHAWCDRAKALGSPKSHQQRTIPLTSTLYKMFLKHRMYEGYVFTNATGHRFSDKVFNKKLGDACERANVKKVTCHILRHTFASHLAMAGVSLRVIQELLGHESIQMTERYVSLTPATHQDAIDVLERSHPPKSDGQHTVKEWVNSGQLAESTLIPAS